MNNLRRNCIVYDYETTWNVGSDPKCDPVQLAAIVIDLKRKEIISGSDFCIDICPPTLKNDDYYDTHAKTIDWHCKIQNSTIEELFLRWGAGTPEKQAWKEYLAYVKSYSKGETWTTTPILAGMNIRNFDMKIDTRLHERYGTKNPFWRREVFDIMELFGYWFLYSNNPPHDYKLDTVRKHFGMSLENAHDAMQDVKDSADILIRFLNLFDRITQKVPLLNG